MAKTPHPAPLARDTEDRSPADTRLPVLALTWIALLVLLALTMGVSQLDLGVGNVVANMAIAAIKSGLVLAIFMNLKAAEARVRLFALGAFFWLVILFLLSMSDWAFRH